METQYSHLKFYDNSVRNRGIQLGSNQIIPTLVGNDEYSDNDDDDDEDDKPTAEKLANILEYLKSLPRGTQVRFFEYISCFILFYSLSLILIMVLSRLGLLILKEVYF
jgi:hypothetical protein